MLAIINYGYYYYYFPIAKQEIEVLRCGGLPAKTLGREFAKMECEGISNKGPLFGVM